MSKGSKYIVLDEPARKFLSELKHLRESFGKCGLEVSRSLNIPNTTYSKYELGGAFPSVERLMKLAEYFGYDLSESLNYKYFHGEIQPEEIKRKLEAYGLTYVELQQLTGMHYSKIYESVHLSYGGSLAKLDAVLKVLYQEQEQESFREELCAEKKVKRCRKS